MDNLKSAATPREDGRRTAKRRRQTSTTAAPTEGRNFGPLVLYSLRSHARLV